MQQPPDRKQSVIVILGSLLLPALALALGWGVRGVFGHERGAALAGGLAALALAVAPGSPLRPRAGWLLAAGAAGFAFGGLETYGQTVWLTEGPSRAHTYWWGMLGLALKGGVWMGLGGLLVGMASGCRHYRRREVAGLCLGLLGAGIVGTLALNRPFSPPARLPALYFSNFISPADPGWRARPEYWGGLWLGFLFLWSYLAWRKRDPVAWRLGAWGLLGGAVGFPAAQALNAWPGSRQLLPASWQGWIDWWKVVEMGFGFIAGLALGGGAYQCRRFLPGEDAEPPAASPLGTWVLGVASLAVVAAAAWELLPEAALDWPFGPWLLAALLAFGALPLAWICGLGLPVVLNLPDLLAGSWQQEPWPGMGWRLLAGAILAAAALGPAWRWGRRPPGRPGAALALLASLAALMGAAKVLAQAGALGAPGFLPERAANSAGAVSTTFLLLALVITIWTAVAGRGREGFWPPGDEPLP